MKVNLPLGFELNCYINRRYKRTGICSQKFDEQGKHMILWDFDDANIDDIINGLVGVQWAFLLPTIYIIESSENHYHAYCFAKRELKEIIGILSTTPNICEDYLRLGMVRGYYTLRISRRKNENFELVKVLSSEYPREMLPNEVTLSNYITYNGGSKK